MPDNWKPCYPRPAEAPEVLNDSRCNSSSNEAGVLVAHHLATARPLRKETILDHFNGHLEEDPPINAQLLLDAVADWFQIMKFKDP
ncbi:hypothetical protein AVEN_4013-1 [Araneus ventricosus]|uniref:Uncharacterized protein n=1 Tax=Araneus ventricosus TaxID=182803 RepID=A0A4Y2H390_ARAVE|nr:hypothetical protein AVEN_4013-1 [Araneus ventricosus]